LKDDQRHLISPNSAPKTLILRHTLCSTFSRQTVLLNRSSRKTMGNWEDTYEWRLLQPVHEISWVQHSGRYHRSLAGCRPTDGH